LEYTGIVMEFKQPLARLEWFWKKN